MAITRTAAGRSADPAAILLHARDTVATALIEIRPGQPVRVRPGASSAGSAGASSAGGDSPIVKACAPIPIFHKIAIRAHAEGEPVIKYGEAIGIATRAICPGEHVHTHNLRSPRGESPSGETLPAETSPGGDRAARDCP